MQSELDFWPRLVLASLATWRLAHLLAHEDGPWDLIARASTALGRSRWGRMLDCFYCLSLWVAAPMALWVVPGLGIDDIGSAAMVWLALSGAACLCESLCERVSGPEVEVQALPEEAALKSQKGEGDELLRPTT